MKALMMGVVLAISAIGGQAMAESKKVVFAGGCFWCMESEFKEVKGIQETLVGYAGGESENPTYEQVGTGTTGHRESLEVTYDPTVVSYEKLLEVFWSNVDPLDATGQFCDQGPQYKSGIFVADDAERKAAEASKVALAAKLGKPVATDILPAAKFWPAEAYHQNYSETNPFKYRLYRTGCGRDGRLNAIEKMKK
jgi:peptide-methionine (S)-S-oxide reductase